MEIKSKEDILNEQHRKAIKGFESIHTKHFPLAYQEAALNAMEVYAEQEYIRRSSIENLNK